MDDCVFITVSVLDQMCLQNDMTFANLDKLSKVSIKATAKPKDSLNSHHAVKSQSEQSSPFCVTKKGPTKTEKDPATRGQTPES